jgi:predicted transcriptional regulator
VNVEELMTRNVVTIHPDTTVEKAVRTMNMHEIGCLIVCERALSPRHPQGEHKSSESIEYVNIN